MAPPRLMDNQVYLDVMGVLTSAVSVVSRWLAQAGIVPVGFDGGVYLKHFGGMFSLPGAIHELRIFG